MKRLIPFELILITFGLFITNCDAAQPIQVHSLSMFKEGIFDDPLSVLSSWNALDSDPCNWVGVSCSGDQVTKLNISGSSITGFIARELFQLSSLQELILHGNKLIGSIPKEIGSLKDLKILDLGMNQISGPIPHEIGNLVSIVIINLQSNGLIGQLPSELGNLKNLRELRLDRNKLRGSVPGANASDFVSNMQGMYASNATRLGFCRSASLKVADFSYNFLSGSIPKCLGYLPRTSFQGNCLPYKDIKQRTSEQCGVAPPAKSHKFGETKHHPATDAYNQSASDSKPSWVLALEVVTGIMVGSLFLVALFTTCHRCKNKPSIIIPWKKSASERDHIAIFTDPNMLKDVMRYNRHELEVACEDFSNIIGSSSDSLVYKGTMKGGPEIAVISLCIKEEHWSGYLELYYQKEVADLARLNHENTGKLLGYCIDDTPFTRMLVFEYASNGTLYEHLHYEEGCQLSWTRRMKIVIGIAKGLKYLHTEIEPPFTISELNSSAVYLTEDFSPKLVDFESWKTILTRSENNSRCISNEGAVCVLPSSLEGRQLDIQGNIYAFGVLLLEIISGRPPLCKDKGCLVDWAKDYLEKPEEMASVVDPALKHFREEDLKVICEIVSICIHLRPRDQVSMQDLCAILESKIDTSVSSELKASSLAWAELALSS
ncbi:probable LRR receptor-like serine/threonine-protein kinase At1g63430 [Cynara cardunculus var. scolymus]|uniref:probable LRR receptor-like serine/threonine-protein kinase At1g63430 n=1 Tax=Cynara cardunculus var. scolymus TaxID=59895 RepID=UPI000D62A4D8|nr:probable LRR receptor-like serine/threonine-protein kinase At1g63430 [Cynara cardunculus var. scolymus]